MLSQRGIPYEYANKPVPAGLSGTDHEANVTVCLRPAHVTARRDCIRATTTARLELAAGAACHASGVAAGGSAQSEFHTAGAAWRSARRYREQRSRAARRAARRRAAAAACARALTRNQDRRALARDRASRKDVRRRCAISGTTCCVTSLINAIKHSVAEVIPVCPYPRDTGFFLRRRPIGSAQHGAPPGAHRAS